MSASDRLADAMCRHEMLGDHFERADAVLATLRAAGLELVESLPEPEPTGPAVDLTTERMLATLRHDWITTRADAEALDLGERDDLLDVAAWGGAEAEAWDRALWELDHPGRPEPDPAAELRSLRRLVRVADSQLAGTFAPLDAFGIVHDDAGMLAALRRAHELEDRPTAPEPA